MSERTENKLYEFIDEQLGLRFILEIDTDDEIIKQLLDQYRREDENYNNVDWINFLQERGYTVKEVKPVTFDF